MTFLSHPSFAHGNYRMLTALSIIQPILRNALPVRLCIFLRCRLSTGSKISIAVPPIIAPVMMPFTKPFEFMVVTCPFVVMVVSLVYGVAGKEYDKRAGKNRKRKK